MKMKPSTMRCLFVLAVLTLALVATTSAKSMKKSEKKSEKRNEDNKSMVKILSALEKISEQDRAAHEARDAKSKAATLFMDTKVKQLRNFMKNQARKQDLSEAAKKAARISKKFHDSDGPEPVCDKPMLMCEGLQIDTYPNGYVGHINSDVAGLDCFTVVNFNKEIDFILEVDLGDYDGENDVINGIDPPVTITLVTDMGMGQEIYLFDPISASKVIGATRFKSHGFVAHFKAKPTPKQLSAYVGWTEMNEVEYPACQGREALKIVDSGYFMMSPVSGGDMEKYINDVSCAWHIVNPDGGKVKLVFMEEAFGMECGDMLEVRDGDRDNFGPQAESYSCGDKPTSVTSTGNELFVQFMSDMSGSDKGFQAYVEFVADEDAP